MNLKKTIVAAAALAIVVVIPFACKTQKAAMDCTGIGASYSKDIAPLIQANCMPCHSAGSIKGDFTTYQGLNDVASNGELEEHVLVKMDMPKKGPLPEEDRKKIKCWLSNGHQNN